MLDQFGLEKHFVVMKQVQLKKESIADPTLLTTEMVVASLVFPEPAPVATAQ